MFLRYFYPIFSINMVAKVRKQFLTFATTALYKSRSNAWVNSLIVFFLFYCFLENLSLWPSFRLYQLSYLESQYFIPSNYATINQFMPYITLQFSVPLDLNIGFASCITSHLVQLSSAMRHYLAIKILLLFNVTL